jgi:NitT/TauT family transport system substrate-binding protein
MSKEPLRGTLNRPPRLRAIFWNLMRAATPPNLGGESRLFMIVSLLLLLSACSGKRANVPGMEVTEVRIPRGAGGVGFLPLLVMEKDRLIERQSQEAGISNLSVKWIDLGGPAVMNEALLSGSVDFIAAGPPAFLILWDRTRDSAKVLGVAAMSSLPMYLNTRSDRFKKLDDITDQDKIAVTSIKVSIPSIIMQMIAREKFGATDVSHFDKYTVTMTHPDAVIALLSGSGSIDAHFTSPPFHQRERKDPRTRTILNSDEVMGGSTTFTMLSTTTAFREKNPKVYTAVLKALDEAIGVILSDKEDAADILLQSTGESGFSRNEIISVLNDPDVKFTTTPEHVMKYADFMHAIGSLKQRPSTWQDLFFPEIQDSPGS